jgi:hypothetical protein
MPYKDKEQQAQAQREHYQRNRDKFKERQKLNRERNKIFAWSKKIACNNCDLTDKACLDFHHLNDKSSTIANLIRNGSIASIEKEIVKCLVLCANCHKKEHLTEMVDGTNWNGFNPARIEKRQWFIETMKTAYCSECNENDSRCLEFHHIGEKRFEVAYLLTSGHSIEFLKEEIDRCQILCSNCHRKKHAVYPKNMVVVV